MTSPPALSDGELAKELHRWAQERARQYSPHDIGAQQLAEAARRLAGGEGEEDVQLLPHKDVKKLRCFDEQQMAKHDAEVRRQFAEELVKWCEEMPTGRLQYPHEIAAHIRRLAGQA